LIRQIAAILLLLAAPAQAADLTVLSAGAFSSIAAALTPAFEANTGNKVTLRNDTVGALLHRIAAGEPFDVILISPAGLDELSKAGKIVPASITKLAQVGIGVGIKSVSPASSKSPASGTTPTPNTIAASGTTQPSDATPPSGTTPPPDISTVAAFKTAMLNARTVAYIDPASGGSSGIYLAKLFQTMGIADAMAPKSVLVKGGLAATAVLDGRADLVIQQISEVIAVPGITLIGPLPPEIQNQTIYAGAIAANSATPAVATAFLATLTVPPPGPSWQPKE
jgi:molybdate transport system substrate-binding protein